MTLSETALAFARECMGWENPKVGDRLIFDVEDGRAAFAYTDLNDVEEAVRNWCKNRRFPVIRRFVFPDFSIKYGRRTGYTVTFRFERKTG